MRSPYCLCPLYQHQAGRVGPEKTAITRKRLSKNVPAETNTHATIEELLDAVSMSYKVGDQFYPQLLVNISVLSLVTVGVKWLCKETGFSIRRRGWLYSLTFLARQMPISHNGPRQFPSTLTTILRFYPR
jgi:hypothetical protein